LEELGLPYTEPDWVLQQQRHGWGQQHHHHHQQQQHEGNGNGSGGQLQLPKVQTGRPLLVVVSRLTVQKGLPLILHGIKTAIARGAQVGGPDRCQGWAASRATAQASCTLEQSGALMRALSAAAARTMTNT
jgi:glycogen synthase